MTGDDEGGAPAPRANPDLVGHDAAEATLLRWHETGRLPHALLLTGPRGIGKATLAFRFARFMLSGEAAPSAAVADMFGAPAAVAGGLAIAPDSGAFRRVAAGGHADLLTVERAYDPRRKRLRSEIVVDDVREIGAFLHLTPAEGGWRVVIVDGADEMNRNAANALLKVLEEPPRRALLLLVAHSSGVLLPTIRSRCQQLHLAPLSTATVAALVARYRPDIAPAQAARIVELADGSIGRALELAASGGVELYQGMLALLSRRSTLDPQALHAFADRLARPDADDSYHAAQDLLRDLLARIAASAARGRSTASGEGGLMSRLGAAVSAARLAELREEVGGIFARTDGLNMDRKQAIMSAFFAIERAAG